ncbi:MAG: AraC family transcriptional regulator [Oscillospiraceae bacterium]|nr:AraC family transcriptional regulator [Oscillospiraceae bacterium]
MNTQPIEWVDAPCDTKERKIVTGRQLGIPGLRMMGHHNTSKAIPALTYHYHKDAFEMTFFVQGHVRFRAGDHSYSLTGGDLFVVPPNEPHDTGAVPLSLHQMYWFQLEANDPAHFLFMEKEAAGALLERLRQLPAWVIQLNADRATEMLTAVFQYINSTDPFQIRQGAQLLGFFLYWVVESAADVSFRITPDIGRATNYIMEHIQEELSMEELAQTALLSVSRFKQKFKLQLGISPRNFINLRKVEAAKRLLQEGHSVTQVAMDLGFSSSNYFSSVFRRYTSYSPSQYALRAAQEEEPDSPEL